MKHCPFCAGVIPDAATLCKHCKQAIPSVRSGGRRKGPVWLVAACIGVLVAAGAPALVLLRPTTNAGAVAEEGRRGQFLEGLRAAQGISNQKPLCDSPTVVADAWRKLKVARRDDPEWEHATKMTAALESCRAGIAHALSSAIGSLRVQQRLDHAEVVRQHLQTQGFDTRVALTGAAKDQVLITSPQFTSHLLGRLTTNLSMAAGSFLEAWQKLGCARVTFTDGGQRWAYELPRTLEAFQDVSVLTGMGIGQPLALTSTP